MTSLNSAAVSVDTRKVKENPITLDEIRADLARTREKLDGWIARLEVLIGSPDATGTAAEERGRSICEATRMVLSHGGFLDFLTTAIIAGGCERPAEAWDSATIKKVEDLLVKAEEQIAPGSGRCDRVHSRLVAFQERMSAWVRQPSSSPTRSNNIPRSRRWRTPT